MVLTLLAKIPRPAEERGASSFVRKGVSLERKRDPNWAARIVGKAKIRKNFLKDRQDWKGLGGAFLGGGNAG